MAIPAHLAPRRRRIDRRVRCHVDRCVGVGVGRGDGGRVRGGVGDRNGAGVNRGVAGSAIGLQHAAEIWGANIAERAKGGVAGALAPVTLDLVAAEEEKKRKGMAEARTRALPGTADHPAQVPLLHGCAPQVVLAVPHEVKPQEVVISTPLLPDAKTVVGMLVRRLAVPEAQDTPLMLPLTVERDRDFGIVVDGGAF